VLVLAAGALLVSRGSGQDQDEASTEPATLAVTDDAGADGAESRSAEAATATEEAAPMVAAEDAPESADPGEDATSGGATAEGDIAPGTEAPAAIEAPETAAAAVELVGSTALAAYAEETVTAWRTAGTWPPPPDDRCVDAATAPTDAIALGEVAYAVSEAEALRPALLLTDGSTSEVRALDPSDCRVLDEAELDLAAP
jgi:hypothetical protein